jgi:3-oxoacyl-[acyl-carrier-protein] synthase II
MRRPVAITAVGVVSSIGNGYSNFRDRLFEGRTGARPLVDLWGEEARDLPVKFAGFVRDDEIGGDGPPADVRADLDRSTVFGWEALAQIVERVGLDRLIEKRASLSCGVGVGQLMVRPDEVGAREEDAPARRTAVATDYCTHALWRGLGLKGTYQTFAGACSASVQACIEACDQVSLGVVDMAIGGGHDSLISPAGLLLMYGLGTLSEQTKDATLVARPFDRDRDGTMLGEGAAYLLFESLESAQARGAEVLAIVSGHASSLDGHHATTPDPQGKAAIRMVRHALAMASLGPDQIDYVNAHGTGTLLNDVTEARILADALDGARPYVSSTKPQVGHLIAACGAIEMIACIAALDAQRIPPNVGFEAADPEADVRVAPKSAPHASVRHVLSNSFGFGGQNTCVILSRAGHEA